MSKKYILQLGLAFTLLYAGISILMFPSDWIGFVPVWVEKFGITLNMALKTHAIFEMVLGVWLLSNWNVRWVAILALLDIGSILIVSGFSRGTLFVTFRDIGLLMTALYLTVADE